MTAPNVTVSERVTTLEGAVEELRRQGLRLSSARRLVLETLERADRPLTAEEIADGRAGMPPADRASVYRNLETLERAGVVRHMHLGHGPGVYVPAWSASREYLVCEACGTTQAVDAGTLDPVRDEIRERLGFEARFSHFPLFGLCARCAREHAHA